LSWLASLFGTAEPPRPEPPDVLPTPPPSLPDSTSNPWLDLLGSILFWVVFVGVVGYTIIHFLRRNQKLIALLRQVPVLAWLMQILRSLWATLRQWNKQIGAAVNAGLQRLRPQAVVSTVAQRARFASLRRMSPRERVQYFYLVMVRRSGQRGMARQPSQTPREYAHTLETARPDVSAEIDSLTDSFVEARYSEHAIAPEHASAVQRYWERIKTALRTRLRR